MTGAAISGVSFDAIDVILGIGMTTFALLPCSFVVPSFFDAIQNVLRLISQKEMMRIDAKFIVAFVQNEQPGRNFSVVD